MRNKKGEVITMLVVWLGVVVVGGLIAFFRGPDIIKATGDIFHGGSKNQAKQIYKVEENRTPFYQDANGKFVPAVKQDWRKEYRENTLATEPPLTWMQRYGWVIGLIVIILIAFPSLAIGLYTKAKSNLTQIVTGIENAKIQLPSASVAILENNLSKKMDTKVKAQVKKIKAAVKADDLTKPVVTSVKEITT